MTYARTRELFATVIPRSKLTKCDAHRFVGNFRSGLAHFSDENPINSETKWKTRFVQLTEFTSIYTRSTARPYSRNKYKGVNCISRVAFATQKQTQSTCGPPNRATEQPMSAYRSFHRCCLRSKNLKWWSMWMNNVCICLPDIWLVFVSSFFLATHARSCWCHTMLILNQIEILFAQPFFDGMYFILFSRFRRCCGRSGQKAIAMSRNSFGIWFNVYNIGDKAGNWRTQIFLGIPNKAIVGIWFVYSFIGQVEIFVLTYVGDVLNWQYHNGLICKTEAMHLKGSLIRCPRCITS